MKASTSFAVLMVFKSSLFHVAVRANRNPIMITDATKNMISHLFILSNAFHPNEDPNTATPSASNGTFGGALPASYAPNGTCQNNRQDEHDKPASCKSHYLCSMRQQAGVRTGKKDDHEEHYCCHRAERSQICTDGDHQPHYCGNRPAGCHITGTPRNSPDPCERSLPGKPRQQNRLSDRSRRQQVRSPRCLWNDGRTGTTV